MGIVAFYCGEIAIGKQACLKAIEFGLNSELDKSNLKFYEDKEKELLAQGLVPIQNNAPDSSKLTKKQFVELSIVDIKKQFPRLKMKQVMAMANTKWKNRSKST